MKQYVKLLEGKRLKSDALSSVQPGFGRVHFVLMRTNIGLSELSPQQ
jgi:hypothetical protein